MTDSTALVELEKRLAEATGADREIDARLTLAVLGQAGFGTENRHSVFSRNVDDWARRGELARVCDNYEIPKYTASIDAALALVSRCFGESKLAAWDIGFAYNGGPYSARIYLADTDTGTAEIEVTHRHSPALALCLALVRALQSKGDSQ
jgi:hypothetical protein